MTPELYVMLLAWLRDGTDAQRAHAAYRLSLPDAIGYESPAGYTPLPTASPPLPPMPVRFFLDPRAFAGCLYASDFVAGCCSSPATARCHWKAATVTLSTCVGCIGEMA